MVRFRNVFITLCAAALLVLCASALVACGDKPAATWAHGEIAEADVTTAIENMRNAYGMTDDESWGNFLKERSYDSDADSKEGDGSAKDLREYVINEMIRQAVIDYQVEQEDITVSDQELDDYVEQARQEVESQYMAGVFDSYLEQQGFANEDEFRDSARDTLAQQKLQQQATGSTDDQDAWDDYVDGLVENAQVTINEMPTGLSYDVPIPAGDSSDDSDADDDAADESADSDSSADSADDADDGADADADTAAADDADAAEDADSSADTDSASDSE